MHRVRRLALLAGIAVLFTAWMIQCSVRRCRLAVPATNDDVSYFNDAVDRMDRFDQGGMLGLLKSFRRNPPHAPFSTVLAFVSFGIFGLHDWAPYAGNALIVLALLTFVEWMVRDCSRAFRGFAILITLCLPCTQWAVVEFRPDMAAAIATSIGVFLLAPISLASRRPSYSLAVGLVFGLALLIKPSMCVLTAAMLAGSMMVSLMADCLINRNMLGKSVGRVALTWTACLVVSAPYYLLNHKYIIDYIYNNTLGKQAHLWSYTGTKTNHLLYYLTGGAVETLGPYRWPLAIVIILGACTMLRSRQKADIVHMLSLGLMIIAAWAVPTATPFEHGLYGLTLYYLVALTAIGSMRFLFAGPRPVFPLFGRPIMLAAAAAAIMVALRAPIAWVSPSQATEIAHTCTDILEALRANALANEPVVFVANQGRFPHADTLRWLSRKMGCGCRFVGMGFSGDLDECRQSMEQSHFILAFSSTTRLTGLPNLPSEVLSQQTLALARSLDGFSEIRAFPSYDGATFYLFANNRFAGWFKREGLGILVGPFPQFNASLVCWANGAETRLGFKNDTGKVQRLIVSCTAPMPGQSLTVVLDAKAIHSSPVPDGGRFMDQTIPIDAGSGNHEICITYRQQATNLTDGPVLYRRLQLQSGNYGTISSDQAPLHNASNCEGAVGKAKPVL
jgi:hypothetical protein